MYIPANDSGTHYEASPVETVLNALILGAIVVTCAITVALQGVQVVFA